MFRCMANSTEDPKSFREAPMVTLYFDQEGLAAFANYLTKLSEDPEILKRDGHSHFRDVLNTPIYHAEQRSVASKDILIRPLAETIHRDKEPK
ncbi:MAG: hypothetical protein V4586_11875 [Pseudomonadota bacterium]